MHETIVAHVDVTDACSDAQLSCPHASHAVLSGPVTPAKSTLDARAAGHGKELAEVDALLRSFGAAH
jgi:hypothetical protein